jgi:hypothetical protein
MEMEFVVRRRYGDKELAAEFSGARAAENSGKLISLVVEYKRGVKK